MRVLYVNHTAEVSGGERSLLGLLAALPDSVQPLVATPPGDLQKAVARLGIPTTSITGTAGSLRLHPLHSPRAIIEMALAARDVRRAARAHSADLVHANSIRAGIVIGIAPLRGMATVVHVRDCLPPGALSTLTMRLIARTATVIIANSRYTARSVRAAAPGAEVQVIYNPVDLERWDPDRIDRPAARARIAGEAAGRLLLGVVAQLTPWKGQDTAIEALNLLVRDGVDAQLLIAGSAKFVASATRFDNRAYVAGMQERVEECGLQDRVTWLGEREDIPELMRALDILLLPSLEEPFGRAVIEAMAVRVPVIATNVGGPAEIIQDGREGYLLPPGEPRVWADAIRRVAEDPDLAAGMGLAGRRRVEEAFTVPDHVNAILGVYERALSERRARSR